MRNVDKDFGLEDFLVVLGQSIGSKSSNQLKSLERIYTVGYNSSCLLSFENEKEKNEIFQKIRKNENFSKNCEIFKNQKIYAYSLGDDNDINKQLFAIIEGGNKNKKIDEILEKITWPSPCEYSKIELNRNPNSSDQGYLLKFKSSKDANEFFVGNLKEKSPFLTLNFTNWKSNFILKDAGTNQNKNRGQNYNYTATQLIKSIYTSQKKFEQLENLMGEPEDENVMVIGKGHFKREMFRRSIEREGELRRKIDFL